jgi:uncharacterized protein YjbI with pentapeptide repeats
MSERPEEHTYPISSAAAAGRSSANPPSGTYAAVAGTDYDDPITPARKAELRAALDAWNAPEATHGARRGPFDRAGVDQSQQTRLKLTGADVAWLAAQVREHDDTVARLHLQGADLRHAHLEDAALDGAHLEGATLHAAYLGRSSLQGAHLQRADLSVAHLQGAYLSDAYLQGADLRRASFDGKTHLNRAILDAEIKLGDVQWGGVGAVNLTQIDWQQVLRLGDERAAGRRDSAEAHEAVVRAYRQVAAQLRAQGMSEVADRFTERAQVRQRGVLLRRAREAWRRPWRLPGALGRYLGSWFLALLAGYGYRPGRTLLWYLVVVLGFMWSYVHISHGASLFGLTQPICAPALATGCIQPLQWYEALVLSVASFHGRGFFPQGINLGDPVAILAAGEAVIGLLVEITFIATFTQRFFGAK